MTEGCVVKSYCSVSPVCLTGIKSKIEVSDEGEGCIILLCALNIIQICTHHMDLNYCILSDYQFV